MASSASSSSNECSRFEELSRQSLDELETDVIPFWLKYGVDRRHGGFMCGIAHDGRVLDASKFCWYQGRGAWVFAKLYDRYRKEEYLQIAIESLAFVETFCRYRDDDGTWMFRTVVSRDGSALPGRTEPDKVGYASLFYAEGLQAVAKFEENRSKRKAMLETAVDTCKTFLRRCEDKTRDAPESYLLSRPYRKGTRTLGHQMIPLRLATQMLTTYAKDEALSKPSKKYLEGVARDMMRNVMERFWDADVRLSREELSHSFAPLRDPVLYYLGHAIEAYHFCLSEACRRSQSALIELSCDRIRRHVECATDPVFGGLIRGITLTRGGRSNGADANDHNDKALMDKVAWVQQEALVALLMVRERSSRPAMRAWAAERFSSLLKWVRAKFPLRNYDSKYALWMCGADRRATFQEKYSHGDAGLASRKENYHHPRFLMCVVEEYERFRMPRESDN